jgi:hypothetical protein
MKAMRLIGAPVFRVHGLAPAGIGSTPRRGWLAVAVGAKGEAVPDVVAAGVAFSDTGVADACVERDAATELPAEHPASEAAITRNTT